MRKKFKVNRLEDYAFTAAFREILSNLLLCPQHRPEDKRNMNSYSSLIALNPYLNSQNIINFIRNRLDHHLVGTMNDEIKKRLVREFNQHFYDSDQKSDLWPFYDCVLDNSFTELDSQVVFPQSEPNEKFIQSIVNHSPNIGKLRLKFEFVASKTSSSKIEPIVKSLVFFSKLTSLSLFGLSKHYREVIGFIGKSCPELKHLTITGFQIDNSDIFRLIVGESLDSVPDMKEVFLGDQSYEDDVITFKISTEFLVPLCGSLEELQLEEVNRKVMFRKNCEYSKLSPRVVAFALRHFSHLRRIDHYSCSASSAIKLLSSTCTHSEKSRSVLVSRTYCAGTDDTTASENYVSDLSWKAYVPFSGILQLTSLDFVNISCLHMMKSVGKVCPLLKEVVFSEFSTTEEVTLESLFSILSKDFSMIETVTFVKVSTKYREIVLSSIGSRLQQVTFVSCESISLENLEHCTQLKTLQIYYDSSLGMSKDQPEKYLHNPEFLPMLNRVESDICLGNMSQVFEEKATLTHLDLDCCHISTKSSLSNWNNISQHWQRIHTLRIRRSTGLSLKMAKTICHQLPKLKELTLPSWTLNSKSEREESYDLIDYFKNGAIKLSLKFERSQSSQQCPFQVQPEPYESSDEEIESDSDDSYHLHRGTRFQSDDLYDDVYEGWLDAHGDYDESDFDDYDDFLDDPNADDW